ncbi:hypothetical protein NQ314_004044 [Rhamnusium bicolor]|uniref:Clathrin interactor 1 n=1 Tax=Rhamnusium bicolor TaxID=1586634 RepID=A0AAV8ZN70_9CUCU|nr:hypothetical protein NQ314_004044 [Rhamnusium bicolor]
MPQTGKNLLSDDFDPRAGESQDDSKSGTEFRDFETAFGNNTSLQKNEDSFADFGSAFSQNSAQNNQQLSALPNLLGSTTNVVPKVIPPPNMSSVPNLLMGGSNIMGSAQPNLMGNSLIGGVPPTNIIGASPQNILSGPPTTFMSAPTVPVQQPQENNSNDLLGDLSDFGNMSIQPQTTFTPANNNSGFISSSNNALLNELGSGKFAKKYAYNSVLESE